MKSLKNSCTAVNSLISGVKDLLQSNILLVECVRNLQKHLLKMLDNNHFVGKKGHQIRYRKAQALQNITSKMPRNGFESTCRKKSYNY